MKEHPVKDRVEKVKLPFREHKETYIGCAATAAVCVVGMFVLSKKGDPSVSPTISQPLAWKPEAHQTTVVHFKERANLSKPVRWIEKDALFPSQNETAKTAGVSPSTLSQHLNGKQESVNGQHFERIPMVEEVSLAA